MSYPFTVNDGGRSNSRRPKQRNDCTVRAIAVATGLEYDYVYDELAKLGRKVTRGWDIKGYFDKNPEFLGFKFEKTFYPAERGKQRMNPVDFANQHPTGNYICRVAKHVYAVIDGVAYDTSPSYDGRCVYLSWKVTEERA